MDQSQSSHDMWIALWKRGETPWDLGGPHPGTSVLLQQWVQRVQLSPREALVVLPGAGHGHDAAVFLDAGMKVHAIDIAAPAAKWSRHHFRHYKRFSYKIADAISVLPSLQADVIFDRAMLFALEPEQRGRYLASCHQGLQPQGMMMVVLFEDRAEDPSSAKERTTPPFAITKHELSELMQDLFHPVWIEDLSQAPWSDRVDEYVVLAQRL